MVLLGSGFDCRALWLDGLREGYYGRAFQDLFPASWWMVEATV